MYTFFVFNYELKKRVIITLIVIFNIETNLSVCEDVSVGFVRLLNFNIESILFKLEYQCQILLAQRVSDVLSLFYNY